MNYLIVGSGLFGSTFAYEAAKRGHHINVIEKRNHIGGNIYTKNVNGIDVHKYGAHIFHTRMKNIWDYINHFATFNNFINSPIANYNGEIYNMPFNMNTFNKMWGVVTPKQAKDKIEEQKTNLGLNDKPANLEEQGLSLVGQDIYNRLIKGYTEKQWGRSAKNLPAFIIRRIPLRFTYDNNYFNDLYQGIPKGGYTQIIKKMLSNSLINVQTDTDFFSNKKYYLNAGYDKIIFTGMIDQFFDYKYGELGYRSLKFKHELKDINDYQGNAVVNYTDSKTPYTRIIEHKHFEFGKGDKNKTVITKEYPKKWHRGDEPYYPVNNERNRKLYTKYYKLARNNANNVIFGGRLGQYRYYNMDQTIMSALQLAHQQFGD